MAAASSLSSNLSDQKRALVIGNNEYVSGSKLRCCTNDAEDIKNILQKIYFNVTIGTNLTWDKMKKKIYDFVRKIQPNDLVVLFFAGHGTQWNDQNFLIPIDDDQIEYPEMVRDYAINVQETLTMIMNHNPFAAIILLDCCRTYLLPNEATTRTFFHRGGLSAMRSIAGSVIAFACDANQTTPDSSSSGRNGLFTTYLLKHIGQPNLTIDEIMTQVCKDVVTATNGGQRPYRLSCLSSKVYLHYTKQNDSKFVDIMGRS